MNRNLALLAVALFSATLPAQTILVQPYVQPGNSSARHESDAKSIQWLTDQTPGDFTVEYTLPDHSVRTAKPERVTLDFQPVNAPAKPDSNTEAKPARPPEPSQHYFKYNATLAGLPFDSTVQYRVKMGSQLVREAAFATCASSNHPVRFVMVGDLADGRAAQNAVAFQISRAQPQFLVALGDIVYPEGRVSQYMDHFWRTYNQPKSTGPETGAPLMASVPFHAVLGNHDVDRHNLATTPDALGVYYFFNAPNPGSGDGPWNTPIGNGPEAAAFRTAVGASYPALGVYSFDNGPAHFLILDDSGYVNLESPALRAWIESDLRGSRAPWKFVCVHAPLFHSSREHYTEQKTRLLAPLLQTCGVDVVFAGHVHNYQRSRPFRFEPNPPRRLPGGYVNGDFQLDTKFDGQTNTHADGVIHIVSGGGGASLYSVDFEKTVAALRKDHPDNYAPFTAKYIGEHSFSLVEVTPVMFTLRQISVSGKEIDRFTITKAAR
ncbi:MAG: metallophosphoesterase [Verrucomicrobiota bacterium]